MTTDILIIGTGTAGLTLALNLAKQNHITVISKDRLLSGSSPYAQGGIAAVLNSNQEEIEAHITDTIKAGDGLCDLKTVSHIIKQGETAIPWLVDQGVLFSTQNNSNEFHLTREGGHSRRRIIHAQDKTGRAVMLALTTKIQQHPNITILEHHIALDLTVKNNICHGAIIWDERNKQAISFIAQKTILATGGANSLYQHTTSQAFSSGDGIAMAWRAGCKIENMEFIQFHPTRFYHHDSPPFLITEAMRGEGAKLTLPDGTAFLHQYDARAELAPRDIVARAMHHQLEQYQLTHLILNISHRPADQIRQLFPSINQHCAQFNIDITADNIPVVPAAHYTCGGINTDTSGKTNLQHLYAIGEVANTGLHGANRMASNSLLECVVVAMSAAQSINQALPSPTSAATSIPTSIAENQVAHDSTQTAKLIQELQQTMWQNAGIARNNQGLLKARTVIENIQSKLNNKTEEHIIHRQAIELRNLVDCAKLTVEAAIKREQNCGSHYNVDTATQAV